MSPRPPHHQITDEHPSKCALIQAQHQRIPDVITILFSDVISFMHTGGLLQLCDRVGRLIWASPETKSGRLEVEGIS